MSDYIGLKLGNYHIVRLIGRGGFAHVYQGEHIYLKTPAAIKVLNMHLMNDVLEKFLHEARIIALLEHPHIVRVLEFGVEGITPFLVMNYAKTARCANAIPKRARFPGQTLFLTQNRSLMHSSMRTIMASFIAILNQRICCWTRIGRFNSAISAWRLSPKI
jgi:serine/threonine protein kinase